jgi:hypothetical protein
MPKSFLQGTSNTRDIGGYQTGDLRTPRWGQVIRSDNLSRLTASDFQKLEEIGVDQEARGVLAASLTTERPRVVMGE